MLTINEGSDYIRLASSLPKITFTTFKFKGIEYAGPKEAMLGNTFSWLYFVLFTTRAEHLEFLSQLNSDAFMAAFRRLIAPSGCPKTI